MLRFLCSLNLIIQKKMDQKKGQSLKNVWIQLKFISNALFKKKKKNLNFILNSLLRKFLTILMCTLQCIPATLTLNI